MSQPPNRKEIFRASKLLRSGGGREIITPGSRLRMARPIDAESLIGRFEGRGGRTINDSSQRSLSARLQRRIGSSRGLGRDRGTIPPAHPFDMRQRAVVQTYYFTHKGGAAKALKGHARYIARDTAARAPELTPLREAGAEPERREEGRPAPVYSGDAEQPERWVYYDATSNSVDGASLAETWGREDKRHFRIMLSAENGGRLGDLKEYVRDVIERAEAELGMRLQWAACDHWDTDNPHTHIILRGRAPDGTPLFLPRYFVQHRFRDLARDVATDRLGRRSVHDERLALQREARAHRPTRLDRLIAHQLDENREVRLADLKALSPDVTDALKARARELERMGLAQEVRRNVMRFEPDWRDSLRRMELHLDINKARMQTRGPEAGRDPAGDAMAKMMRQILGLDR